MTYQIENPEIVRKLHEVARRTGLSEEQALDAALSRMMSEAPAGPKDPWEGLDDALEAFEGLPVHDTRRATEILDDLYGPDGLPR